MKVYIKSRSGNLLTGILEEPHRNTNHATIMVHGFTGNKDSNFLPELAKNYLELGLTVLRFDLSHNGESEGIFKEARWEDYILDLYSVYNFLKRSKKGKILATGFSMGAAISLLTEMTFNIFDGFILIAPLIEARENTPFKQIENFEENGYYEFKDQKGRHFKLNVEFFKKWQKLQPIIANFRIKKPTLIVIGENDESIDLNSVKEFAELNSGYVTLQIIKGEDHIFHNSTKMLLPNIKRFLMARFSDLKNGKVL